MNNSAARFFLALAGVLLALSFIFNKWIKKELVETVKPNIADIPKKTEAPLPAVIVKQYDMSSDYPHSPEIAVKKEPVVVKKPERVLDKKIIYEMPTSDKFLVQ